MSTVVINPPQAATLARLAAETCDGEPDMRFVLRHGYFTDRGDFHVTEPDPYREDTAVLHVVALGIHDEWTSRWPEGRPYWRIDYRGNATRDDREPIRAETRRRRLSRPFKRQPRTTA